ncbi:hypothetical protein, partial [Anditalea andensis]
IWKNRDVPIHELYAQPDQQDTANPYYIGKGNPHADILMIKFITFTDPTRQKLVISTRQLSTSVSGELMQNIVEEINRFKKLKVS